MNTPNVGQHAGPLVEKTRRANEAGAREMQLSCLGVARQRPEYVHGCGVVVERQGFLDLVCTFHAVDTKDLVEFEFSHSQVIYGVP